SDTFETVIYNGMNHEQQWLQKIVDQIAERYLQLQGFSFAPSSDNILMWLGFEGNGEWVARQWNQAMKICSDHEGISVGRGIGQSWLQDRYKWPYLRDALVGHGVMVGRLETMVAWTKLMNVYEATISAIKRAILRADGGPGYVMTRIAYANEHSALLRFIFLGRQVVDANPQVKLAQVQVVKQAAAEAILNAGGALPYYQGIDRGHGIWLENEIGALGMKVIRNLKQTFDPGNILNTGMLLRL
ncbi:MAG TPA: hypothetical protein ENN19_03835, partial [Chloroflexi bacterium]|nr:hypothetical protein [Chloroflexota bacterium]